MSDEQNCIHCGEPVNYSCEPEHGETGRPTKDGPAHHRCIMVARIYHLESFACSVCKHKDNSHDMNCLECCPIDRHDATVPVGKFRHIVKRQDFIRKINRGF